MKDRAEKYAAAAAWLRAEAASVGAWPVAGCCSHRAYVVERLVGIPRGGDARKDISRHRRQSQGKASGTRAVTELAKKAAPVMDGHRDAVPTTELGCESAYPLGAIASEGGTWGMETRSGAPSLQQET